MYDKNPPENGGFVSNLRDCTRNPLLGYLAGVRFYCISQGAFPCQTIGVWTRTYSSTSNILFLLYIYYTTFILICKVGDGSKTSRLYEQTAQIKIKWQLC